MSDMDNRIALVIGGASGMGLASARALAAQGAEVIIADLDGAAAERAAQQLVASGGKARACQVDASSLPHVRALIDFVDQHYGRLNVLFSNVGSRGPNGFDVTEEQFDDVLNINLKTHFFATNYAAPLLRRCAPHASVIYMASGAGLRFFGRSPLYAISKAGLLMMMRSFARHLGPDGIRVNALCPGPVETAFPGQGMEAGAYQALKAKWSKDIPLGRIAQADDIANVVAFLASDQSMYLSGLSIPVDGGFLA